MKRSLYIGLGCLSLVVGAVGAVVPLLPSFPFLLAACYCFAKSSPRLHTWFTSTSLYKKNLESYVKGKGMTRKAKVRVIATVTLVMSIGFAFMGRVPVGRVVLALVWVGHVLYFIFGVKERTDNADTAEFS